MSKRVKIAFITVLAAVAGVALVQTGVPFQRAVIAAESTPISTKAQLHQKYLERKQLLDQALAEIEQRIAFGYDAYTSEVYFQAKEAALRAGIDLSESMEDRMNLYNDILKLYVPREKQLELEVKAGQRSQSDLNKIKVERLNVEIEMLKEQLNESD